MRLEILTFAPFLLVFLTLSSGCGAARGSHQSSGVSQHARPDWGCAVQTQVYVDSVFDTTRDLSSAQTLYEEAEEFLFERRREVVSTFHARADAQLDASQEPASEPSAIDSATTDDEGPTTDREHALEGHDNSQPDAGTLEEARIERARTYREFLTRWVIRPDPVLAVGERGFVLHQSVAASIATQAWIEGDARLAAHALELAGTPRDLSPPVLSCYLLALSESEPGQVPSVLDEVDRNAPEVVAFELWHETLESR